jgi:hypothetical protein
VRCCVGWWLLGHLLCNIHGHQDECCLVTRSCHSQCRVHSSACRAPPRHCVPHLLWPTNITSRCPAHAASSTHNTLLACHLHTLCASPPRAHHRHDGVHIAAVHQHAQPSLQQLAVHWQHAGQQVRAAVGDAAVAAVSPAPRQHHALVGVEGSLWGAEGWAAEGAECLGALNFMTCTACACCCCCWW